MKRSIFVLCLSLLFSFPAASQQGQVVTCTAGRSPDTPILVDECGRLWKRHIYIRKGVPFSLQWQQNIALFENAAFTTERAFDQMLNFIDIGQNLTGEKVTEERIVGLVSDSSALFLRSIPIEGNTGGEIGREAILVVQEGLVEAAKKVLLDVKPTFPYVSMGRLLNKSNAWFNQQRVNGWRSTAYLADRYFESYYLSGSGHASVAAAAGLGPNAEFHVILDALYEQYGLSGQYDAKAVQEVVEAMIKLVEQRAAAELDSDIRATACARGSNCSPTSPNAEQQIIGHFRGSVTHAEPAGRVPGGVAVGDPVSVEIIYDTTPDLVHRHVDIGAVGYYFDTNTNEHKFEVRIGDSVWLGDGSLGTGGVELLVYSNLPDGSRRAYDYVRFAAFEMTGARAIDSANAQFFLGSQSVHTLEAGFELPTSLSDFAFTREGDSKCCFSGIMEGRTGNLGDADTYQWHIGIQVDRSTFELGSAVP